MIIHVGNARFIDGDPVGTEQPPLDIYPYAYFRSLEHVEFGLVLTNGGPKGDEIASVKVGQYGMEPLSSYWEFDDALDEIEKGSKYAFEEVPYVEVQTEDQYNEVLDALELEEDEGDIFDGPGLYDFRDTPPTYQGTVEDNELADMERAADEAFEFMFQGDEWNDVYQQLAEEADDDNEEEDEDE
jgi:hypothetical protein